jgi:hypothetical protein
MNKLTWIPLCRKSVIVSPNIFELPPIASTLFEIASLQTMKSFFAGITAKSIVVDDRLLSPEAAGDLGLRV